MPHTFAFSPPVAHIFCTVANANKWIHVLLPVLEQTLLDLGDLPARHLQELALRLEALRAPDSSSSRPFFITTEPNGRSHAPKTAMSKKRIIAARRSGIQ